MIRVYCFTLQFVGKVVVTPDMTEEDLQQRAYENAVDVDYDLRDMSPANCTRVEYLHSEDIHGNTVEEP